MRISVVIVNWNRAEELASLLGDLALQTAPAEEIIVVDNGSTDASRQVLATRFPHVRVIALERNTGLSHGRNVGIEAARGDWIAILDNDLRIPDPDFWQKARCSITSHPDCGVITFHLFQGVWDSGGFTAASHDARAMSALEQSGRERRAPIPPKAYYEWFVWGGCCLIRRRTFETVGLFDAFFGYGGEEWDFAYRCHAAGVRLLRDTSLWAVHGQSPRMRSPLAPLLILQNMIVAQARYMPLPDLAAFLLLQMAKSGVAALRSRTLWPFCRMLARLVRAWPTQVASRRRPVSRETMHRFYFLRLNQPTDFRDVERARTSASEFYAARARAATPEQTEPRCIALMQQ